MSVFKIPIDVEGVLCYNNFRSKWYKGLRHLFHTILYRGGIMKGIVMKNCKNANIKDNTFLGIKSDTRYELVDLGLTDKQLKEKLLSLKHPNGETLPPDLPIELIINLMFSTSKDEITDYLEKNNLDVRWWLKQIRKIKKA